MNVIKHHTEVRKADLKAVSLWIDSYSDVFSDFDPRPFSERMISDDFINQVRRVSRETKEKVSVLQLLVPEGTQKEDHERVIRKRLQTHFYDMHQRILADLRQIRSRGIYLTFGGLALMLVASYITFLRLSGFHINILLVLFEPGGWFLFWTGLESLFSFSRTRKHEMEFYSKLSGARVEFASYR